MGTMKKFKTYLLIFIGMFLFVSIFTNLAMRENFVNITNHEINVNSPKVIITESKASYSNGNIKGSIINDTGKHIKDKYLQFDFYDKDGIYVGTESKEIKYFNVKEKVNFDINYTYKNVDKIKINLVDEVIKPKDNAPSIFDLDMQDEEMQLALPFAAILALYLILP